MRLTSFRVTDFRSIYDSSEIDVGSVTCLVGKNESGKTAILRALYQLNPVVEGDGDYDATADYPRLHFAEYEQDVENERTQPAVVTRATFSLDDDDIAAVSSVYGHECFVEPSPRIILSKGYGNCLCVDIPDLNERRALTHMVHEAGLKPDLAKALGQQKKVEGMLEVLRQADSSTDTVQTLLSSFQRIQQHTLPAVVKDDILGKRIPKFLYFDHYFQMKGQDNLEALQRRVNADQLEDPDRPLLGLIDLARLRLDQLLDPRRTEALIARLEAAESHLTEKALKYWSQNRHLRMTFDIRPAYPDDPPGMTSGMNVLARVKDTKRNVSTPLGVRSQGFVWFFSFLAWYSRFRQDATPIILLLDEPGLSLHGKAQGDLLHYFECELKPHHQLMYTTHSPFMVDPSNFDRVRIVQDLSIDAERNGGFREKEGTEVTSDVLKATPDSLFPLQGALGYEIHQSLFVGPNNLVVEGVSDLIYLQVMSMVLQKGGHAGLNSAWTITPVGGAGNVPTFVALLGAQSSLKVAVLLDRNKKDTQRIENLYKSKILKKNDVMTYADYVNQSEADVEDMFTPQFYLELVNRVYNASLSEACLSDRHPRILVQLERHLEQSPLPDGAVFNHYRPASYLSSNIEELMESVPRSDLERFQKAFDAVNSLL